MGHHHPNHLIHDPAPSSSGKDDFALEDVIAEGGGRRCDGLDDLDGGGLEGHDARYSEMSR